MVGIAGSDQEHVTARAHRHLGRPVPAVAPRAEVPPHRGNRDPLVAAGMRRDHRMGAARADRGLLVRSDSNLLQERGCLGSNPQVHLLALHLSEALPRQVAHGHTDRHCAAHKGHPPHWGRAAVDDAGSSPPAKALAKLALARPHEAVHQGRVGRLEEVRRLAGSRPVLEAHRQLGDSRPGPRWAEGSWRRAAGSLPAPRPAGTLQVQVGSSEVLLDTEEEDHQGSSQQAVGHLDTADTLLAADTLQDSQAWAGSRQEVPPWAAGHSTSWPSCGNVVRRHA